MSNEGPMIAPPLRVALVDAADAGRAPDVRTRATQDRSLIEQWARPRGASPATGEGTSSGAPSTFSVNDGDAGIRFNFPGHAMFRPISWDEWFDNFERYDLAFVFDADAPGQPPSNRWRLMPMSELRATASIV